MKTTKCNNCGELSNNQYPGNLCHTCQNGIMEEIEEDNSLKEWQRGYFGYPSGLMAQNKRRIKID